MQLKELRTQKHYTQRELARRLGVGRSTISDWEKGGAVAEEHLPTITRLLGSKPDEADSPERERKPRSDKGQTRRESINADSIRQSLAGVNKSELSQLTGISRPTIISFEQGGTPRLDTLRRLRDGLKTLRNQPPAPAEKAKKPRKPRSDQGQQREASLKPWWEALNEEPIPKGIIRANGGIVPPPVVGAHGGIPIRDLETYARGQELTRKRKALGVTEKQLARHLGVSVWRIIDAEIGRGGVSPEEYEEALERLTPLAGKESCRSA